MTPWSAYSVARSPAWVTRRAERMSALPWAVWLGARTSRSLADEWQVTQETASQWLQQGQRLGVLRSRKIGRTRTYRVARMEVGMVDRSTRWTERRGEARRLRLTSVIRY